MSTIEPLTIRLLVIGLMGLALFAAGCAANVVVLVRLFARPGKVATVLASLRSRPWRPRDLVMLLTVLAAVNLTFFLSIQWLGGTEAAREPASVSILLPVQTVLFHGLILLLVALILRHRRLSWRTMFGRSGQSAWRNAGWGVVLYLAAIPYFSLAALGYRLILTLCRYEAEPQGIVTLFFSPDYPLWLRVYLLLVGVLIAPIAEEIAFRGIVFPMMLRRTRLLPALVVSALLFAWIHMHIPALVPLFVIAVAFALGYAYTGSILTPIVMHLLFNAVNLTALYLLRSVGIT